MIVECFGKKEGRGPWSLGILIGCLLIAILAELIFSRSHTVTPESVRVVKNTYQQIGLDAVDPANPNYREKIQLMYRNVWSKPIQVRPYYIGFDSAPWKATIAIRRNGHPNDVLIVKPGSPPVDLGCPEYIQFMALDYQATVSLYHAPSPR